MPAMTTQYRVKAERVASLSPRKFRPAGKLHYPVRIFIEADDPRALDEIKTVQYKMHESFKEPYRVSSDRRSGFEVIIWTYGYFDVEVEILKLDGTFETIIGEVSW
jgi:transcription initiation factor IIF auxiliary subunit